MFIFLTTINDDIHNNIAVIKPKSNTKDEGLSIEGIAYGKTVDPKNNWPIPSKRSESLSSWEFVNFEFIPKIVAWDQLKRK
jgi:hypothetical protein